MPVNYQTPSADQLFPVAGIRLGTAEAEIRKKNRRDLTLVEIAPAYSRKTAAAPRPSPPAASIWRSAATCVRW